MSIADRLEALGRVAPAAARDVLEERMGEVVEQARAGWPVESGDSRRALEARTEPLPEGARSRVRGAPYAPYIRIRGRRPWQELTTSAREALARLGPALKAEIVRRARG